MPADSLRVQVTLEVDVDKAAWARDYGIPRGQVEHDVAIHLPTLVDDVLRKHAVKSTASWDVATYPDATILHRAPAES